MIDEANRESGEQAGIARRVRRRNISVKKRELGNIGRSDKWKPIVAICIRRRAIPASAMTRDFNHLVMNKAALEDSRQCPLTARQLMIGFWPDGTVYRKIMNFMKAMRFAESCSSTILVNGHFARCPIFNRRIKSPPGQFYEVALSLLMARRSSVPQAVPNIERAAPIS